LKASYRLGDVVARDVELDAAREILQRRKAGLAHHAFQHHATGDSNAKRLCFELFVALGLVRGVKIGGQVRAVEVVGKRVTLLAQGCELGAPLGDDLVFFFSHFFPKASILNHRAHREAKVQAGESRTSAISR